MSAFNGWAMNHGQSRTAGGTMPTGRDAYGAQSADRNFRRRYEMPHETNLAGINAATSRYPHDLAMSRFNQVFPALRGALGGGGAGASFSSSASIPRVDASPIWSQQQVQQQVNSARAQNDQSGATRLKGMQDQMAASGFGSQSPLALALQGQIGGQTMAANADASRGIRWDSAQGNAQHVQRSQMANADAAARAAQIQAQYASLASGRQNALIAALASIV